MDGTRAKTDVDAVSSPISTGQGGAFFEQHVDAVWFSLLLVRGIPPVLTDSCLAEVHLQARHLGWQTDDAVLVGVRGDGEKRHLAVQVKRSFSVSTTDEDCRKAFVGFWEDFNNRAVFDPTRDALALVVQRGTNVLLEGLGELLDTARASKDASDFTQRLTTPGLLSKKSINYVHCIRDILQKHPETPLSEDLFWGFLKSLHLLSFDVATATRQTEAGIKTMLAHTANGHDRLAAASQTWSELLEYAGNAMPHAGSIDIQSLPEPARKRHSPIPEPSRKALDRLRSHSRTVLRGLCTRINNAVELPRRGPVANILNALAHAQALIVAGPAGFGKSGLAKMCVQELAPDSVVFSFRAEELTAPHLDEALHRNQIGVGAEELFALLAGQSRKVLHLESMERLLESSQRDATLDLLRLIASDPSWRVVITCRDYSLDTVRAAFLDQAGLSSTTYEVPELTDDELQQAMNAIPNLRRPLSSEPLKKLLRNPYYLDKAAAMSWPAETPLPESERAFRKQFWHEVVRRDDQRASGMPKHRERTFIDICVRRAKALEPFVGCKDLDPEVLGLLEADGLIAYGHTDSLAAPAHDTLEDWAVLHWVEEAFDASDASNGRFCSTLGSFPAIRRVYRNWVTETVGVSQSDAINYVAGVLSAPNLPAYFRDDTLVAVLLSPVAGQFLGDDRLFVADTDCSLLRRIIHLTRVACKAIPTWLRPIGEARALCFMPSGPAWPAVLRLVWKNVDRLVSTDLRLVIGVLTDWSALVAVWNPHPEGMEFAARTAHYLLPLVDNYSYRSALDEVLRVIIKIPKGDEQAFGALTQRAAADDRTDHVASRFAELLLTGPASAFACMDAPDVVISLAKAYLWAPRERRSPYEYSHSLDIGYVFGLREHLDFEFSEASALRGPFLPLLQHHSAKGVAFIIETLNKACEGFAERHKRMQYVDGPWQVDLRLPKGVLHRQWCEHRLWGLYRGTTVGPHVLQCALMALESWLLNVGEKYPEHLDKWLVHLLRESNNVAISAVVASVAVAFPKASGEAALALLSCRDLVLLDRQRMVSDLRPPSSWLAGFPARSVESRLYADERRQSDGRKHRRLDLESVAIALGMSPLRDRVYAVLDAHRSGLPAEDKQTEADKVWRLALHRMDFRRYAAVREDVDQPEAAQPSSSDLAPAPPAKRVVMMSEGLEPDLEAFRQEDAPRLERWSQMMSLYTWGTVCFRREVNGNCDPNDWRSRLTEARVAKNDVEVRPDDERLLQNGIGFVAAVCVRDHYSEMAEDERCWCITELLACVHREACSANQMVRVSRNPLDSSRPSALVLPLALTYELSTAAREEVRRGVAVALAHACDEVVTYAVEGIRTYLADAAPGFVLSCAKALIMRAAWLEEAWNKQLERNFDERVVPEELGLEAHPRVVEAVLSNHPCTAEDLHGVNLEDPWGREAMGRVLRLLGEWPTSALSKEAFSLAAIAVARWWAAEAGVGQRRQRSDFEAVFTYLEQLADYCVRLAPPDAVHICRPLLQAVQEQRDEVEQFITQMTIAADRSSDPKGFWTLWREFAERVKTAQWLDELDHREGHEDRFLSAFFLGGPWKQGTRHWRCLEGYAYLIDELFVSLPAAAPVFRCYTRFLDSIGEQSLPQAIVLISRRLRAGDAARILFDDIVVLHLEAILGRLVYGRPTTLKSNRELRDALLHLLDELVLAGSSAAYRMRDDFVTPATGAIGSASP